ncbi:MAG: hypothetical protein QXE60_06415, partial [Candidatus Methanomethylicaceae archaeon]
EEKTKVINSEIRGPCIIGKDCLIQDSFIGPYTSVGNGTKIINSSIEHSVILENAFIKDIEKIDDSLIGKNSKLIKNKNRNILRLNIGDYSEIEI